MKKVNIIGSAMRYGELRKASGKITQKMLTQTLGELEKINLLLEKFIL